jgi:hypothetical protein
MKTTILLCRWSILLSTLVAASFSVAAGISAEQLKQRIQARSKQIAEFRALLNDPDQAVRLAALDEMLSADDVAMRELAFGLCFESADAAMRAICLRKKIADLNIINVEFPQRAKRSDDQAKVLKEWGGMYTFGIEKFDPKTGHFVTTGVYRQGSGQVSGIRLDFRQQYCSGSFTLGDGAVLEGELGCWDGWTGTYQGLIRLQ